MIARLPDIRITAAATPADWDNARMLVREYAASLGIDLAFQGFDVELAALPQAYAGPAGVLLLARVDGALAACGAVRPRPDLAPAGACEMKRLYVRPGHRELGLGRRIAEGLMAHARAAGHAAMLLDTLAHMASARALYASLGFEEIPAYYVNPIAGAHYLRALLTLRRPRRGTLSGSNSSHSVTDRFGST